MAGLLESFLQPDSKDLTGLMAVLHDILQCLGLQGVVSVSLKLAQHLLSLFENVSSWMAAEKGSGWGRGPQQPRALATLACPE